MKKFIKDYLKMHHDYSKVYECTGIIGFVAAMVAFFATNDIKPFDITKQGAIFYIFLALFFVSEFITMLAIKLEEWQHEREEEEYKKYMR